jgi:branched-chain amino acid transport system ATP-binding protein
MSGSIALESVQAGYGEMTALHGVDVVARPSEITALIGANGVGKSTSLRVMAGLLAPKSGRVLLDGEDITRLSTHERVARGIVLVPEGRQIFPEMSVRENLLAGALPKRARASASRTMEWVLDLFPRLGERIGQAGGTLSGGEQQMLALGRGLMARPRVLLLDEPTLGLAPGIAKQIFQIVPRLVSDELTVVMAEQDVHRTLRIASQTFVIRHGRVVQSGTGSELRSDDSLRQAYLGHA